MISASCNAGRLPFDLRPSVLDAETLEAIADPSLGKSYADADEMIMELLA